MKKLEHKKRKKTRIIFPILLCGAILLWVGYICLLQVSHECSLEDVPGISSYAIAQRGVIYNLHRLEFNSKTGDYVFYLEPVNKTNFRKDKYIVSGSGERFNNLVREFEYITNKASVCEIIIDTLWGEIVETASGVWNMIRHPIKTGSQLIAVPEFIYDQTKDLIEDPHILQTFYTNEVKKAAEAHHIDFDEINLEETLEYLKQEVNAKLFTGGSTYILSCLIPSGVAMKGVSAAAKTMKVAKHGKNLGKINRVSKSLGKGDIAKKQKSRGKAIRKLEGKKEFYPKVTKTLEEHGIKVTKEEDLVRMGRSWRSRPDFVGHSDDYIIVGEIKSAKEGPRSGSWRKPQKSDTSEFRKQREIVATMEKSGEVSPDVGGWMIIIKGQVEDYVRKMGKTWDVPDSKGKIVKRALTAPADQAESIKKAFGKVGIRMDEVQIIRSNDIITFIW